MPDLRYFPFTREKKDRCLLSLSRSFVFFMCKKMMILKMYIGLVSKKHASCLLLHSD